MSGDRGSNFMIRDRMGRHATVVEGTPFGAHCVAQLFDGLVIRHQTDELDAQIGNSMGLKAVPAVQE